VHLNQLPGQLADPRFITPLLSSLCRQSFLPPQGTGDIEGETMFRKKKKPKKKPC